MEEKETNVKKSLGTKIKELRKYRGMTQEQLAEIIGIEPNNVSMIEIGKNYPAPDNLAKIAKALGAEIYELFMFNKNKTIEEIKESVIDEIQRNDNLARLVFKFCQAVKQQ